jgi:hypothetical protein
MSNHTNQQHGSDHHSYIPYWKRAHTDWRFWVGVMLMFLAMLVYVMSGDFALRPRVGPPLPEPADVTK